MCRKQIVINTVKDLVGSFLYYDRKEDEELSRLGIDSAINTGEISIKEIVSTFEEELKKSYPNSI